ncbi:MAG: alpha/beta fold hydrolase [Magnetococcales bacterium]|nr:alpha/beta fold hydrolase [Magnetococcales bacterium]
MSDHLVLAHGWGFGPGVWRPMLRHLPEVTFHAVNLGYFGPGDTSLPTQQQPFVAIGHSLGVPWLLRHLTSHRNQCRGLISINGFSRFANTADFPTGVGRRILDRMRNQLQTDPHAVLHAFQQQAGLPTPLPLPAKPDITTLTEGLTWLCEWDEHNTLNHWPLPMMAIASRDDRIVTPAMTEATFSQETIHWLPEGGHLLPLTQPATVASLVRTLLP